MWPGFKVRFFQKGFVFSSSRHHWAFQTKFSLLSLVHTEFWPHPRKISGVWWKILRGGFPCLQFHLELRLRLTLSTLPVKAVNFSLGHPLRVLSFKCPSFLRGSFTFMYSWWPVCWHVWWFSVMSFYSNICLNLIRGDPNDLNSGGFLEERICFSNFCWEPENHFNPFGGAAVTMELPKSIFLSLRPPHHWSLGACPSARGSICSKKTLVFLVVCCSHFRVLILFHFFILLNLSCVREVLLVHVCCVGL